ncbi:MAG TPA: nuclear transport factor 2 family protein [Ktedonobacteraceae bacterium]|nr:nuclear transport factor 2 family protein [Ktedonobacteraceae bacterium]
MNQEQTEQEVAQLANTWASAELQGDTAFLEHLLAGDFIGVGPLGFLLTKQQWLARHQSGDMKYTAHTLDEIKVRAYNEAAIVIGRLTQQATYQGNPMNVQMRTTLVFAHQHGQWQLASLHFCNIGQPPSFARS